MEVKHSFLVETCLLTHGLRSIADDEILSAWPDGLSCITWVDEGSIRIGSAAEYILFRRRCRELDFGRIDSEGLEEALSSGGSGALTASGTMAVCERLGVPLAVTCGMGGICDIKGGALPGPSGAQGYPREPYRHRSEGHAGYRSHPKVACR